MRSEVVLAVASPRAGTADRRYAHPEMPPKHAFKCPKAAATVARAPAAKPPAAVVAPGARPPIPVNLVHNVAATAAGASASSSAQKARNPQAAKPAVKAAAPAAASASASSAPAARANLFRNPGKDWETTSLHNQQPQSADPTQQAYHHKMSRDEVMDVPNMMSPAGQRSLLDVVQKDARAQRGRGAGGTLPAPGRMLASFSGNLALGPIPTERHDEPGGSKFDPNPAAGGGITPRSAEMKLVRDHTTKAKGRAATTGAPPLYSRKEEKAVTAAFRKVHALQQARADPRVESPGWDTKAGTYGKEPTYGKKPT